MKSWLVNVRQEWVATYRIEAETAEEAKKRFNEDPDASDDSIHQEFIQDIEVIDVIEDEEEEDDDEQ